jgi:hypothetical protein
MSEDGTRFRASSLEKFRFLLHRYIIWELRDRMIEGIKAS